MGFGIIAAAAVRPRGCILMKLDRNIVHSMGNGHSCVLALTLRFSGAVCDNFSRNTIDIVGYNGMQGTWN
jgi:hypothetical protein